MSDAEVVEPEPHTIRPPEKCPKKYIKQMGSHLGCEASITMQKHKVPWHIIAQMITDDYTTDKELAERWLTKAEARTKAATDLQFNKTELYSEPDQLKYAMRVAHAVEAANETKHQPLMDTIESQHKTERKIDSKECNI